MKKNNVLFVSCLNRKYRKFTSNLIELFFSIRFVV